jgi:hypothetical protein
MYLQQRKQSSANYRASIVLSATDMKISILNSKQQKMLDSINERNALFNPRKDFKENLQKIIEEDLNKKPAKKPPHVPVE